MRRYLFTAALLIAASPAFAVDFKTPIKQIDGSPIPVSTTDPTPLTLGKVCEDALLANNLPGDAPTPAEKTQRFWLALKIHGGKDPLTADEIATAKKAVGLAYGPLIVGRSTELLDPASVPK